MKINKSRLVEIIKEEMVPLLEAATPDEIAQLKLQRDDQLKRLQALQQGGTPPEGPPPEDSSIEELKQQYKALSGYIRVLHTKVLEIQKRISALEGSAEWEAPAPAGGAPDPTKRPWSGGTPTMTKTAGGPSGKLGPSVRGPRSTKSRSPMGKGAPTTPSRGYTK